MFYLTKNENSPDVYSLNWTMGFPAEMVRIESSPSFYRWVSFDEGWGCVRQGLLEAFDKTKRD